MADFVFRLDPVLHQRRLAEEQAQRELALHLRRRLILQTQVRQMQQGISHAKRDLADTLRGRVDMTRVGQFAHYSGQSAARAQMIVLELSALENRIDKAREKLLTAARARQALELLRERRYAAWRQQRLRRETAELDDIAVQRHARQRLAELAR